MKTTGLNYLQLSDYMLKVNLLLIERAPLSYLREVIWAFGNYWFPSSTSLANFDSRAVQFVWAALQFFINLCFAFILIIIAGAAIYSRSVEQFPTRASNESVSNFEFIRSQVMIYGMAATIVLYTAVISCSIEVGSPRYRVPTDSLIVFMLFSGTQLLSSLVRGQRQFLKQPKCGKLVIG
jgi:hypothetical protein